MADEPERLYPGTWAERDPDHPAVVMGGSAARVLLTVVGGEVRYEPETSLWHELRQKGIEARAKLLGR